MHVILSHEFISATDKIRDLTYEREYKVLRWSRNRKINILDDEGVLTSVPWMYFHKVS